MWPHQRQIVDSLAFVMEGVCELLLSESLPAKFELLRNNNNWIHEINLDRHKSGEYQTLFPKLRQHHDKFFRMSQDTFDGATLACYLHGQNYFGMLSTSKFDIYKH